MPHNFLLEQTLCEFDVRELSSPKNALRTVAAEYFIFLSLKHEINKLLKRSKRHRQLSDIMYDLTNDDVNVRIIDDDRVMLFHCEKGNILWISQRVIDMLTNREVVAILLHEYGRGEEKMEILYKHLTRRSPRELKPKFALLAALIKKVGVSTAALTRTRIYLLSYILYTSLVGNPFKITNKWSYGDIAIQKGYWDDIKSALTKVYRYVDRRQKPDESALKLSRTERTGGKYNNDRELVKSLADDRDSSIISTIKKIFK